MGDPFCSLCGGPFRPVLGGQAASAPHVHWTTLARSVCGPQDHRSPEEPVLTGLGFITFTNLAAPGDCARSYKETPVDELDELPRHDLKVVDNSTDRPFPFHEFCWQMLLTKLGLGEHKAGWKQVGAWLFHVLNSVSWLQTGDLMPENRYHGTINLRQVHAADTLQMPALLLADPSRHGLEVATSSLEFRDHSLIQPATQQSDRFTRLPLEVILEICTLLPSKDVGSARLSSRHLAVVCHVNSLPEPFWASRFWPEREMGLILPELLSPHTERKWLHNYFDCKQSLNEGDCLALRNRGRIWRCLEDFAIILDALLTHHGEGQPGELVDETCFLGQKMACPELPDQFEYGELNVGARAREQHHFALQDVSLVQISVIHLASSTYISGIRTTSRASRDGEQVIQEAGLIIPSNLYSLYKVVSIQLVEQQVVDALFVAPISAWNPRLLDAETARRLPPLELEPQTEDDFSVNVYLPFGGDDGSRLRLLCKMTAVMHGRMGFYGFLFTYSDGNELWFGQRETLLRGYGQCETIFGWFGRHESRRGKGELRPCIEQTFMIDGEAGECIDSFDASRKGTGPHGRRMVESIQSPIWAFEDLKAEEFHVEQREQQDGVPVQRVSPPSLTRTATDVGWMLREEGSCFTIASLENIRRVRVSKGAGGRSRTDANVTGILLDYHHGGQSTVVGQWIQEAASFDLEETERVVEFSYWVHASRYSDCQRDSFATITCIRLVTSLGRCLEVRPDTRRRLLDPHVRYSCTPYERLRNITWIFGTSRDEMNISLRPAPALGDGHLCLTYSRETVLPRHAAEGNTRIYHFFNGPEFSKCEDQRRMTYYHTRGLLFLHKTDSRGMQIPVQQVQLTVSWEKRLVGIEFQYVDGSVHTYGTKGGHCSVLHLDTARNERLSRLAVYNYGGHRGIELHTTHNQKLAAGARSYEAPVSVATFPLEVGVAMPDFNVPNLAPDRVLDHGLPTLAAEKAVRGGVGIWVVLKCDEQDFDKIQFEDAGPIYLTGPS
ncbi:unnamed protein product [Clonostachys byssicola]|uniref:F-box domain-containing protein n=1 Tax=Clonostachys byssicola TaxID=160290 RepID=A0A9N9UQA3_9HYPO|nr:unnamed protein product [Clonostachys byssicola]